MSNVMSLKSFENKVKRNGFDLSFKNAFPAKVVYIHKFGVELGIPACNAVRKGICRVERSEHGYAEQNGVMMERNIVGYRLHIRLAGIYDVVYLAFVHQFEYVIVGGQARHLRALYAEAADDLCRTLCGIERQAEVCKLFNDVDYLVFVLIVYRKVDARRMLFGGMFHIESRGNQPLEQRLLYGLAYAQHFARGLHLGPELRVDVV